MLTRFTSVKVYDPCWTINFIQFDPSPGVFVPSSVLGMVILDDRHTPIYLLNIFRPIFRVIKVDDDKFFSFPLIAQQFTYERISVTLCRMWSRVFVCPAVWKMGNLKIKMRNKSFPSEVNRDSVRLCFRCEMKGEISEWWWVQCSRVHEIIFVQNWRRIAKKLF